MKFEELNLIEAIQKSLNDEGYEKATPIQEKAIPELLDGKDLLGCAQTGTGKTAAFALPILQGLSIQGKVKGKRNIRALILAPTRELAIQIEDNFKNYARYLNLRSLVIFGGVSQNPQTKALRSGIDILVATPGRLLDLINQKFIKLDQLKYFVLDEADYMLDMGMIHDVRKIMKFIPEKRQTMFFSATMPPEISKLANQLLTKPVKIKVSPVSSAVEIIQQSVYYVNKRNKINMLIYLLKNEDIDSVLVFSRTKHGSDKIVKQLERVNISALAIHGNKSQTARQKALDSFKRGKTRVLVATDIAARGIDVDKLSYVINFNLPEVPETYVHRIGRTGRAGESGQAISFCDNAEKPLLKAIEKLIRKKVPAVYEHPFPLIASEDDSIKRSGQGRPRKNGNSSRNGKSSNKSGQGSYRSNKNSNNSNGKNYRKNTDNSEISEISETSENFRSSAKGSYKSGKSSNKSRQNSSKNGKGYGKSGQNSGKSYNKKKSYSQSKNRKKG